MSEWGNGDVLLLSVCLSVKLQVGVCVVKRLSVLSYVLT